MNIHKPIDIYCERTDPSFWAEPINAITNLSFLIAALWAWHFASKKAVNDATTLTLIAFVALIGLGSFLFHTFGTLWSAMADVIPIWTFAVIYLVVALRRFFDFSLIKSVLSILAYFIVIAAIMSQLPLSTADGKPLLNGSIEYAPALLAMIIMTITLAQKANTAWKSFATITLIFSLSLFFRSIDMMTCNSFPLGTHFFWHLLNGIVLALLLKAMIDKQRNYL